MLPMDDELFMAELHTNELLPGNLKNELKSLSTSAQKATKFLDQVIQPSITNNGNRILNTLLTVMRSSDNNVVIQLADNIHSMLNPTLCSDNKTGF